MPISLGLGFGNPERMFAWVELWLDKIIETKTRKRVGTAEERFRK